MLAGLVVATCVSTRVGQTRVGSGPREIIAGPLAARLDTLLTRYAAYGFSGTVLVAKDDRVVLHKGYGLADRERGVPNTPATLFEIGSLTKTFTAAAVLQLEARGKLRTDDQIGQYLGPFPPPKDRATIHHLATHTAGLVPEGAELAYGPDCARFIQSVKEVPAEAEPGARYRYTNAGYSVLAAVVEVASGESYESYVRRHLFAPAGISGARFRGDPALDSARLARGYLGTPAEVKEGPSAPYLWGTRGAGGIVATVGVLYRWHLALQDSAVLPPAARAKMFYPWPEESYGWHVETTERGTPFINKGGGMPAYASQVLYYPAARLAILWASNDLVQRWRQALNRGLTAVALGELVVLPPPVAAADSLMLRRYAGRYVAPSGTAVEFRARGEYLYAVENELSIPTSVPFRPTAPGAFTGFDPAAVKIIALQFHSDSAAGARVSSPSGQDLSLRKVR